MVAGRAPNIGFRGNAKSARTLVVFALAALLTGCSDASDLDPFGIFDEDEPAAETAGQASVRTRGDAESEAAEDKTTPKLSSVPERPTNATAPADRQRVVEGLVADRENARYSDESIRLQGESRESAAAPPPTAGTPTAAKPPATTRATTAPPPPPQVGSPSNRRAGSPTQIAPPPPPAPVQLATGPLPSVQVDATALSGGTAFPLRATRVTIDEQVATIHFGHSSSRLDDRDKLVLAQVASAQRQNDAEIVVVGHASGRTQQLDKVEHELANFRISLARANRVAEQLIAMGVASEKVRIEAFADSNPVYSEAMPTGEAGNRRADIYFRQ